jgi:hypothetical protein
MTTDNIHNFYLKYFIIMRILSKTMGRITVYFCAVLLYLTDELSKQWIFICNNWISRSAGEAKLIRTHHSPLPLGRIMNKLSRTFQLLVLSQRSCNIKYLQDDHGQDLFLTSEKSRSIGTKINDSLITFLSIFIYSQCQTFKYVMYTHTSDLQYSFQTFCNNCGH